MECLLIFVRFDPLQYVVMTEGLEDQDFVLPKHLVVAFRLIHDLHGVQLGGLFVAGGNHLAAGTLAENFDDLVAILRRAASAGGLALAAAFIVGARFARVAM